MKYGNTSFRYFYNEYRACNTDETVIAVFATFRDNTGMALFTDSTIYILDDKGQTLESIANVYVCNRTEEFYEKARKFKGTKTKECINQ